MDIFNDCEAKMKKSIFSLEEEFNGLRTGRASTTVFEKLSVESYGSPTPLNQLATISVPDARMVVIQPWDKNLLGDIEKAILKANLGMTPSNDGKLIRISIPPLTDERRAEIVKQAKKISENYKVAIRNIRRDGIDDAKRQEKSGDMTEDQRKVMEDKLQKLTDTYTEKVTKVLATKEAEIMEG
jgi:ribosome recycling factor